MDRETRIFASTVALALAPFAISFGWLFLRAGTGLPLIVTGVLALLAAVVLHPTRKTGFLVALALLVGCWPILFLVAWFAFN